MDRTHRNVIKTKSEPVLEGATPMIGGVFSFSFKGFHKLSASTQYGKLVIGMIAR
jgi:hypothetical protein